MGDSSGWAKQKVSLMATIRWEKKKEEEKAVAIVPTNNEAWLGAKKG